MALALAALGLYGVLSWSVGVRRRELGVRAALGADRRRLALGVAREAVPLVVAGAVLGSIGGWWCARLASALLYQVQPTTGEAWLAAGILLILTSSLAIAIPSRRAAATSPADALRTDE
jgi:putative ABC transport system permease protein